MSFLDEFEKTTTAPAPKKTPSGSKPPVKATAPTSFLDAFESNTAPAIAPKGAPVVSPEVNQAVSSIPLAKTTISAPTGKEVRPVATRIKEFTDKLFGINEKRTTGDIIKDQQKAYEKLVKNPSVSDVDGVSPFSSIQAGRDQRKATMPTAKGIVEGVTDIDESDTPFAGAILDAKEIGEVYLISQKMQKDQPVTPDEMIKLRSYFEKEDMLNQKRKTDAGYRVGETIRNSLTFMLELGGATLLAPETGGTSYAALIAQKGVLKTAKETAENLLADKVVRDAMIKDLKEYGIKASGKGAVIVGSQAAVHVPEGTLSRMLGTPVFSNNMGEISVEVINDGQPIGDAVLNAFTESIVETASEYSGGIFAALPNAVKTTLIKSGVLKTYIAKNPNLTPDVVDKVLKSVGWNGVIGEMGEEQIANVAYGILNTAGLSDHDFHVPTKQEILEQLLSFALMGSVIKTVGDSYRKIVKDNLPKTQGDGKVLTDVLQSYVEEAVQTESPEQIIKDLKEMGMDNATAFGIVNNATLSNVSTTGISPEELENEIASFMSGGAVEDGGKTETAKVAEKVKEERQKAPEAKLDTPMEDSAREAMKETAPFALSEMDIPQEKLEEAEADWVDNFADGYGDLAAESMDLANQVKTAKGERKKALSTRLETVNQKLGDIEENFLSKHSPDTLKERRQLEGTFEEETPTFPPAKYSETNLIVKEGDFIVNRNGQVEEVVSGNDKSVGDEFNEGFLRTKMIGNEADYMNYANQIRKATPEEVEKAKETAKKEKPRELDQIVEEAARKKVATKKKSKKAESKEEVVPEAKTPATKPKRETPYEKEQRLEKERVQNKIANLSKEEKAEIDRAYPIYKRMFEVYDEIQLEFPQMFVGETQAKAMETVAEEFSLSQEEQDFILYKIQYMGPGFVDSMEEFTEYYVSRNLFDKTMPEEKEEVDSAVDNVDDSLENEEDDNIRQNGISDVGDVSTGEDRGSSESASGEVPGYERAAVLTQSGNGPRTKRERQLINEVAEQILESTEYSTNPEDYSENDRNILAAYTGAGGKESVGAEGAGLLNEYYTPVPVIDKMWEITDRLLPNGGEAFEPSAGIGRIIGRAPVNINVDGAEISRVSGTIAKILYPESNITIGDFQELFFDRKTNKIKPFKQYDAVIGNPPFGDRGGFLKGKGEESDINRWEEYFVKRGLDMTKEGGYLVYVVNSSFIKNGISKGKKEIAQLGKLVEAYRLPEDAFEDTSVGTDIVVFRKESTIDPLVVMSNERTISDDIYFRNVMNRDRILGEMKLRKNKFGQPESFVEGSMEDALAKIKLDYIQPVQEAVQDEVQDEVADVSRSAEEVAGILEGNTPISTKKRQKVAKTSQKEGEIKADRQMVLPKKNAEELVVPVQDVSNKGNYSPVEVEMLKRIDRDMSVPTPSGSELPFLNYAGGEYFPDGIYFAGEIYQKLTQLENDKKSIIEALGQEQYDKQKRGLEAVIPASIPLKDISFDPIDRHVANLKVTNEEGNDTTVLGMFTSYVRRNSVALSPRVQKYDVIRYVNGERAAKETKPIMGDIKADAKRLFNHFLKNELDPKWSTAIEEKFNREKNGYVRPNYTTIPVEVRDMAKQFRGRDFSLSQTQKSGVGFLVNKGSGLIAYGVGVGKTHTLAVATVANMQKGWTKRPLFTVPKSTITKTWINTLHEMFPTLTINNLEGLQAPVIRRLKRERGEDPKNWIKDDELTVISHEGLLRLGFNEEELRQAAGDLNDALWKDESTKRGAEKKSEKYDEILGNAQKYVTDVMISDLGFDHVSVDEVHNFRKIFQGAKPENLDDDGKPVGPKRYGNVVGGTPSKRAQQLFLISQYIQKKYGGRNIFLASATPFENHATEVYNILSLVARDRMQQMGIMNINDFFSVFANFEVELDRTLEGKWIDREKMKSFANLPTLQGLLREFIDYQEDPTLIRPERRVITPHLPMSEKQEENLVKIQELLTGIKAQVEDTTAFDEDSKTMYNVAGEGVEDGAFLKASTYSIANSVSPFFIKEYIDGAPSAAQIVEQSPKIQYAIEVIKRVKNNPKTQDFGTFVFFGKMGVEYHPILAEEVAKVTGYKPEEVAYLSGDVTDEQKEDIKERFNDGRIKVLLGGDQTKEGIDLQNNGFITLNLALGWNPTQIAQVEGRVWRQGNRRSIAPLIYPLVENSGDAMIYSKFEEKGGRINDLFSYAGTIFDVGEIDPAEKKLALLTDPRDKANMQVEIDKTALYNERVLIDNDIKELNKLRGDLQQSKGDIEYYESQLSDEDISAERKKTLKAELKKNKDRVERLEAKLQTKEITDLNVKIGELEGQIVDLDNKIKDIDKTFDEKLKYFTVLYQEELKNRKSIEDHMKQVDGLISELEERTPEEIEAMRQQKIKALEEANRAMIPEFLRIEEEEIDEAAQLREESTVLMLDMQNNAGTPESLKTRYNALQKKWEALGRPMFERYEGTESITLSTIEKLKGREVVSKQFISDLTNSGEIKQAERDAVRAVLAEYEDGVNIPVKEFADKVNSSLLPVTVEWEADSDDGANFEYVTLPVAQRGDVANYYEKAYGSPIPTSAGRVHGFNIPNYFAHTRVEDMFDVSDDSYNVRRVIEVQSDLFQKGRLEEEMPEGFSTPYLMTGADPKLPNGIVEQYVTEEMKENRRKDVARLEPYRNTWWQRIIREEIKQAAKAGKQAVQFPTGETALAIEGLSQDRKWTGTKPEGGNFFLNPSNIEVGMIANDGWKDWVIVDVVGEGKFKAMQRDTLESVATAQGTDLFDVINKEKDSSRLHSEVFDVSGKVDTENPIYKFYEKEVSKYIVKLGGKKIEDKQGVSWVELKITPEVAEAPIFAFSRMDEFKKKTVSFAEGKSRLEAYKKRLGLEFDVDFANVIFTGEKNSKGGRVRAYAVTYNNKITLTENITATTADHEMIHAVLANIDKLNAFEGITYDALLKAQNGGAEWTEADRERLEEGLAIGFEKRVAGENMSNIPMVIRKFYDKLMLLLEDFFKAIGKDINIIEDFYRKMAVGESTNTVKLTPSLVADNIAKFSRNGEQGLDFYFQRARDMDDMRRVNFERIVEEVKDFSVVLKRRDINYLDNVLAQARDLYLKNKQEFKEADQFMKIGDTRRMKKELLDQKFADMMKPYFSLSKSEQEAVNMVLMQGDRDTKEYTDTDLVRSKLDEKQIEAYRSVRKAFNVAHQLLIDEMRHAGVKEEEIETFQKERTGYMPHKWKYRFAIKTQKLKPGTDPTDYSNWVTQSIDVYKTSREADKTFKQLTSENEDKENIRYINDTLDSLEVDFFSEQRFSFENMKSIIAKAKTSADVKDELLGAMRDMVKEKGFGRHFIKRTGVEGYEKKDVPEIIANYFAGLNGFVTKMDAGKQYFAVLEKVDARRQKKFYTWLRDSIAYDMGQTSEWNALKQTAYIFYLANDVSFLLTNATQNWTVGIGELSKLYKGAGKIAGAEVKLTKATADWAIGNLSEEEKTVVRGLLKVGRLGGEMTSELMGFKNNPLYTALGKGVNYALYNATRFVEQNVNRVPAFLAARRILKDNGLSDKEANEQALAVSDDINFRYGKQHRPAAFRGRISTLFVFQHYIRSFLYQLARDLKEREFIALTKKLFYTALLGGATALPFARMIQATVKALFGDDPEEETAAELKTWELALDRGIPASFLNVDLSNRVGIDVMAITSLIEGGDQNDVRKYLGAVGALLWWNFQDPTKGGRLQGGADLFDQTRYLEAFGKLMPDFLGNPAKAYQGYEYGVYSQAGNPLLNEDGTVFKYTTMEAFIKATGFTPTREQLAWEEKSKQWEIKNAAQEAAAEYQDKIKLEINRGNLEEAQRLQAEGLTEGALTDRSRDYVKAAVTDKTMHEKLDEWQAEPSKSRNKLDRIERDITRTIHGDDYTRTQLTNVTRDFAFYRTFGFEDTLANEIKSAQSTEEKVQILEKARAEMGLEAFKAFFEKGRSVVHYEASSNGRANSGYVLISDALREAYFKK